MGENCGGIYIYASIFSFIRLLDSGRYRLLLLAVRVYAKRTAAHRTWWWRTCSFFLGSEWQSIVICNCEYRVDCVTHAKYHECCWHPSKRRSRIHSDIIWWWCIPYSVILQMTFSTLSYIITIANVNIVGYGMCVCMCVCGCADEEREERATYTIWHGRNTLIISLLLLLSLLLFGYIIFIFLYVFSISVFVLLCLLHTYFSYVFTYTTHMWECNDMRCYSNDEFFLWQTTQYIITHKIRNICYVHQTSYKYK